MKKTVFTLLSIIFALNIYCQTDIDKTKIGYINCMLPLSFNKVKGAKYDELKEITISQTKQLLKSYPNTDANSISLVGFDVYESSDQNVLILFQSIKIQMELSEFYLDEMRNEAVDKINWGITNNKLSKCFKNEVTLINGSKVHYTDLLISNGARNINLNFWKKEFKNITNGIAIIANTNNDYLENENELKKFINSIIIE
ncbi:hypothetical protein [Marinilabilia salmonicolor]|uniref:hypothetical protein n=1 Tax=Marinilabilia salmonicolor TaxID=989 RepID=UPI00029AD830|nr:hypothetical protein [Marinilabilia salmonicolor]